MSVVVNGHTYSPDTFKGSNGYGYDQVNTETGLPNFPDSIMTDMLAELENVFNVSIWIEAKPYGSEVCFRWLAPRALSFPASLTGSGAKLGTATTLEKVFSLKKNGSEFGTVTFAAGGTTGVFAGAGATFALNDVLTVVAPATPDVTLADVMMNLIAATA